MLRDAQTGRLPDCHLNALPHAPPLRTKQARSGMYSRSLGLAACLSEGGVAVNLEEVVLIAVQRGRQVASICRAPSL